MPPFFRDLAREYNSRRDHDRPEPPGAGLPRPLGGCGSPARREGGRPRAVIVLAPTTRQSSVPDRPGSHQQWRQRRDDSPRPPLLPPVPFEPERRLERAGAPALARLGVEPTATAGSTTASCAPPTASTAPAPARGRSTSRTGIVTWETQQTDYPENGPDVARLRAARLPARRLVLLVHLLAAARPLPLRARRPAGDATARRGERTGDPVDAWASIVDDPGRARGLQVAARARAASCAPPGTRSAELVAAAHVHTIRRCGPDRVVGFSPIPAMSMVSYAAGTRFLSLIGGVLPLSFYDWYADLPPASPQVWGDQTDVPESADWWNAAYLMMWGSNIPHDAHAGRALHDRGALPGPEDRRRVARLRRPHQVRRPLAARAAGHRRRARDGDGPRDPARSSTSSARSRTSPTTPRRFTDLPFLVTPARARRRPRGRRASCAPPTSGEASENAEWKTVVWDAGRGRAGRAQRLDRRSAGARRARAAGTSTSRASTRRSRCSAAATSRSRSTCRASTSARPRAAASMRRGVPGAARRRAPRDDGLRPARRPVRRRPRRACPASGPRGYDDARALHAGLAGGDHRRRRRRWSPASRASSPATPSAPRAAR